MIKGLVLQENLITFIMYTFKNSVKMCEANIDRTASKKETYSLMQVEISIPLFQ